jgi:hypothetical protein
LKKREKKWQLNLFINFAAIRQLSIKSLTLIGFSLVVLPLTIALLYGANQVNKLSQQGSSAIINVADLVTTCRSLVIPEKEPTEVGRYSRLKWGKLQSLITIYFQKFYLT